METVAVALILGVMTLVLYGFVVSELKHQEMTTVFYIAAIVTLVSLLIGMVRGFRNWLREKKNLQKG